MKDFKEPPTLTDRMETQFERVLRRELPWLYRISYRFTGNRPDAEDLVQDLLVKLYPRRDELEAVENLRSWLLRVMYRQFIDSERKQKRSPLRLLAARQKDDEEDPLDRVPGPEPDPEQYADGRILSERIEQALGCLGRDQRAVIALHDMEGYRLSELEILLEVPMGTLKSRLHRARAMLRKILEKEGTF